MKRLPLMFLVAALLLCGGTAAQAGPITLIESFENPFPNWKTGWLGSNSNLTNYYEEQNSCYGIDCRGNNPDGLWIADGIAGVDDTYITFDTAFAATLTSLQLDVAGYADARLVIFDKDGNSLLDTLITLTYGAMTDPGTYATYSVLSQNGIGGWRFIHAGGAPIEGYTSIDNVTVTAGGLPSVPDGGSSLLLLGVGLAGLRAWRKRIG